MYQGKNLINGEWIKKIGKNFQVFNPSKLEAYGEFPETEKHEIEYTVESARQAFLKWRKVSRVKRSEYFDVLAQLLKQNHDELVNMISIETGKNLNESHAEVIEALHMCQYVAAEGRRSYGECIASEIDQKEVRVIRKPRGVVAVISPWNFPLAIGSFWSSAPAIMEGNTVVHKPSEETPMVAQRVAELYVEAGFPPGVYNLIHGNGYVGKQLVASNVNVILFTGSSKVGQEIRMECARSEFDKTCSCECGSKSAVVVFENTEAARQACLASAFKLSGQRCVSGSRVLVQRNIVNEFSEQFVTLVKEKITVGDPFSTPAPFYGPLINRNQHNKVGMYQNLASKDAEILLSTPPNHHDSSLFVEPFVCRTEWSNKKRFLTEEVFGPFVVIIPFDTVDDAIRIYNDTDYGLSLAVHSSDIRVHRRFEQECDAGMLYINGSSIGAESHVPFSSWKRSGNSSSAAATWKSVTHTMAITTNYDDGIQFAQGMKL